MPEYGKPEYWDQRYGANSSNFDWYMSYQGLKEHLEPYLKSDCRILMVGCGNSSSVMGDDTIPSLPPPKIRCSFAENVATNFVLFCGRSCVCVNECVNVCVYLSRAQPLSRPARVC